MDAPKVRNTIGHSPFDCNPNGPLAPGLRPPDRQSAISWNSILRVPNTIGQRALSDPLLQAGIFAMNRTTPQLRVSTTLVIGRTSSSNETHFWNVPARVGCRLLILMVTTANAWEPPGWKVHRKQHSHTERPDRRPIPVRSASLDRGRTLGALASFLISLRPSHPPSLLEPLRRERPGRSPDPPALPS